MLNVETTCTSFVRKQPVMELFQQVIGRRITENFILEQWMFSKMRSSISSLMVSPTHRRSTRKHRCIGLTSQSAADTVFELANGESVSVAEYWEQHYGPLRFPHLPCLNVSKGRKMNYLPPEVCEIVAGQRQNRLTEEQTRETIKFSAQRPDNRKYNTMAMLEKADITNDEAAREFGIAVEPEMIKTSARILPQPHLQYQRPASINTGTRGAWNLEGMKFFIPATLKSWAIVSCMEPNQTMQQGEQGLPVFMASLMRMLTEMGMNIPEERPPLVHRRQDTVQDSLKEAMEQGERQFDQPVELILVLLLRKEAQPYQDFKRVAEGQLGVTTQCFVGRNAGIGCQPRSRMQYLANLAMKINQKLGGINTQIAGGIDQALPVLGQRANQPFIVFGADVTHPTSFDKNEPSVGAIVASMDRFLGQFAARILTMPHREEKMSMREAIKDLLISFYRRTNVKPERVFFYRDGISEGQFQDICSHEYNEFLEVSSTLKSCVC